MIGKALEYAVFALVTVVLIGLVAGYFLGQPVLLAYVETGSMEPTLNAGDGFIAVPAAIAGDVEPGDVVMFEAEHIHGGELTTHRVIDERAQGYLTQGDANPFPDQSRNEPPVTDGQIKAVALTYNGDVVRIPHLGTAVMAVGSAIERGDRAIARLFGTQRLGHEQLAYILFGIGVIAYAILLVGGDDRRTRNSRSRSRSRDDVISSRLILGVCVLLIVGSAMAAMVGPGGTQTYGIVSSEGNSSNPTIIPTGESDSFEYGIHNGGYLPIVVHVEPASSGIDVEGQRAILHSNETANATVTFHAPDETGYYLRSVSEHRYLMILPPGVINALAAAHPWLPYLAINGILAGIMVTLWVVLGGNSGDVRLRNRSPNRRTGILDRLKDQ